MPIYDYRCDHCGHVFHAQQAFADAPLTACPACGQRPRRVPSLPAIVFKGSGWYKTDSRGSGASPKNGTGSGSKDETKSDAGGTKSDTSTTKKSDAGGSTPAGSGG